MPHTKNRFLTIETGEIYQPVRLTYLIKDMTALINTLTQLSCIKEEANANLWTWYWKNECDDLHFESQDTFQKQADHPVRLGTISIKQNLFYIYLPSFKRACMTVPFFHKILNESICHIQHADFINKIFTTGETLPRKFNEIFDNEKLNLSSHKRVNAYQQIEDQCTSSLSMNDALDILSDVLKHEDKWELPYVERYQFELADDEDPQVIYIAFYLFMRSRELVVINRAMGKHNYQLADAANESVTHAFGYDVNDKKMSGLFFRAQALFQGYIKPGKVNVFC
jgi:hypothetical protein